MPPDATLSIDPPHIRPGTWAQKRMQRRARIAEAGRRRDNSAGYTRQCSCRCWPLMVRIIWWALSDRRS
ncbi:MAG: hypothetical protein C0494_04460 [Sphingobium sp.]|uniref:hypothetical protein n=1 Tax=Sphingomonas bisphenolicum TaxID=296544 RepID=UPI0021C45077|nr:hypothetical protein [Sphingomonas bisphenolicum]MBA4089834.1 hypothetical protein [Sphingobium sp.]